MSTISGIKKAVQRKFGKITAKKAVAPKKEKPSQDVVESRTGSRKLFSSVRKVKSSDVAPRAERTRHLVELKAVAVPKRMHAPIEVSAMALYETPPSMPAPSHGPEAMAAPLYTHYEFDPKTIDERALLGAIEGLEGFIVNSKQHLVIKDAGNGKDVKFGLAINDEEGRAKAQAFLKQRARYCNSEESLADLARTGLDREAIRNFLNSIG